MCQEDYYEQLTKSACTIISKISQGEELTNTDLTFLTFYNKQMKKLNKVSTLDKVMINLKKITEFINSNSPKNDEEEDVDEL